MSRVEVHPQLLADCYYLGHLQACELLLHRNACVPWFILVPDTALGDLLDLPTEHRDAVVEECAAVSAFIKQILGYAKVNFAGLGNVVPQMHLHVIGRSEDDAAWPQPVWGNFLGEQTYAAKQVQQWREGLAKMTGLVPLDS